LLLGSEAVVLCEMPKQSKRQDLLSELVDALAVGILEENDDCDLDLIAGDVFDELFSPVEALSGLFCLVETTRYLEHRGTLPKSCDFKINVFPRLSPSDFRLLTRTQSASFKIIVCELQHHTVFQNNSGFQQAPVWQQVAVVLDRLGSYGNGAFMERICLLWGGYQKVL
jgi:hypothetical protein